MKPKRILVVEDNQDVRYMLVLLLSIEGYDVIGAGDGRDALNKISEQAFHLILTDLNMPIINGVELIKRLRQEEEFKNLPIVTITAYDSDEATAALEAGANIVLHKPKGLDLMTATVKKLLQQVGAGHLESAPEAFAAC